MGESAETALGFLKMRSAGLHLSLMKAKFQLTVRRKEEHDHLSVDNASRKLEHIPNCGVWSRHQRQHISSTAGLFS
jgi:hypothetical protein